MVPDQIGVLFAQRTTVGSCLEESDQILRSLGLVLGGSPAFSKPRGKKHLVLEEATTYLWTCSSHPFPSSQREGEWVAHRHLLKMGG